MTTTIDECYREIVNFLEQLCTDEESHARSLLTSFDDSPEVKAFATAGSQYCQVEISAETRQRLAIAVENVRSALSGREPWRQVEFTVKDGKWNMRVTHASDH